MNNAELIKQLRGCKYIEFCSDCPRMPNGIIEPCDIKDAAADALEAAERLLDQNTKRCEALRKQLREAHESYEKHINELEARFPITRCAQCKWWWKVTGLCTHPKHYRCGKDYFCADGDERTDEQ